VEKGRGWETAVLGRLAGPCYLRIPLQPWRSRHGLTANPLTSFGPASFDQLIRDGWQVEVNRQIGSKAGLGPGNCRTLIRPCYVGFGGHYRGLPQMNGAQRSGCAWIPGEHAIGIQRMCRCWLPGQHLQPAALVAG